MFSQLIIKAFVMKAYYGVKHEFWEVGVWMRREERV
jgi:hypothetical protein